MQFSRHFNELLDIQEQAKVQIHLKDALMGTHFYTLQKSKELQVGRVNYSLEVSQKLDILFVYSQQNANQSWGESPQESLAQKVIDSFGIKQWGLARIGGDDVFTLLGKELENIQVRNIIILDQSCDQPWSALYEEITCSMLPWHLDPEVNVGKIDPIEKLGSDLHLKRHTWGFIKNFKTHLSSI